MKIKRIVLDFEYAVASVRCEDQDVLIEHPLTKGQIKKLERSLKRRIQKANKQGSIQVKI